MFAENLNNIKKDNIIISDPIKNSVIQHSNFYKLIYSNNIVSFNGIYILFELNNANIVKDKVNFTILENNETIRKITEIENLLLNLLNTDKNKVTKLSEFFNNKFIKFSNNDIDNSIKNENIKILGENKHFILKISGIWETKDNIGLTFKIIVVNKYLEF